MKIALNKDGLGLFKLSPEAFVYYHTLKGKPCYFYRIETFVEFPEMILVETKEDFIRFRDTSGYFSNKYFGKKVKAGESKKVKTSQIFDTLYKYDRTDSDLIKTIEDLGERANSIISDLKIVEVPDDIEFELFERNGCEYAVEKGRYW